MKDQEPLTIRPGEPLYRQEAAVGLYQVMFPYHAVFKPMLKWTPINYGEAWLYYRKGYFIVSFYEESMERVVRGVLSMSKGEFPEKWKEEWNRLEKEMTAASRKLKGSLELLSVEELQQHYEELYKLDIEMWSISIFIDAFDPGYDRKEMERIAIEHGLTEEELQVLSTPLEPSFVTAWDIAMKDLANNEITREEVKEKFFWYGVSYSDVKEVDDVFIDEALTKQHAVKFTSPLSEEKQILLRHNLSENPLEFYRELTAWRDKRKHLNYVGLYGLVKIAREFLRKKGVDTTYANALLPEQIPDLLAGKISSNDLEYQDREGVFIHLTPDGRYVFSFGEEAQRNFTVIEEAFARIPDEHEVREIKGVVASRGKATGTARILMDFNAPEAGSFKKGDILVTSMTRPEFMPLIRLSAAIVTNEGGITSHAAIVARELQIPCIIGTKNATKLIKDSDLIEVNADEGTVTIL